MEQTFNRNGFYKDIDLSFSRHPLTGDIAVKKDVNAINQSLMSLMKTNFYERPFQPEIGSNIRAILFENADPITISDLRQAIEETIINHEPRVKVRDILIEDNSEKNAYGITLTYETVQENTPVELSLTLKRIR